MSGHTPWSKIRRKAPKERSTLQIFLDGYLEYKGWVKTADGWMHPELCPDKVSTGGAVDRQVERERPVTDADIPPFS